MRYDTHTTSNTLPAKPINTSMFLADFHSADSDARSTYHKVRLTSASRHRSETMLRSERCKVSNVDGAPHRFTETHSKSEFSSVSQQLSFIFPKSQLTFNFVLSNLIANKQERRTL